MPLTTLRLIGFLVLLSIASLPAQAVDHKKKSPTPPTASTPRVVDEGKAVTKPQDVPARAENPPEKKAEAPKKDEPAKDGKAPAAPEMKVSVGGRIQMDTRFHSHSEDSFISNENNLDWFEFRRVRLDAKAKYGKNITGKVSAELSDTPYLKNAYVDFKAGDETTFQMGKFTAPFNPEDIESSKYLTFVERSIGGKAVGSGDDHGFQLFGKVFDDYLAYNVGLITGQKDAENDLNTSLDGIVRLVLQPTVDGDDFFQLWVGTSVQGGKEKTGEDESIKIRPETESGLSIFKASFDPDLDYTRTKFEFDVTMIVGPTVWRTEYISATYNFENPATISGGFVSGSVFLTGETRSIATGYNERQEIDDSVSDDGWGAWELAARYSWFTVSDEFFATDGLYTGWEAVSDTKYGNTGGAFTLALNWYPSNYLRFMLDWVTTRADHALDDGTIESVTVENALLLRSQLEF